MTFTLTKPLAPVGASYTGPGPCYRLPPLTGTKDHDVRSSHLKGPAFSFGLPRHALRADDLLGPGPVYRLPVGIYRDGREHVHAFAIRGRPQDTQRDRSPGPNVYDCEKRRGALSNDARPLAFSFGGGHRHDYANDNPGPNQYALPLCLTKSVDSRRRRSPQCLITGRRSYGGFQDEYAKRSPGPSAYNPVEMKSYKVTSPSFSISRKFTGGSTVTPGPLDFKTERVWAHKSSSPKFSFGIRHSQYEAPVMFKGLTAAGSN